MKYSVDRIDLQRRMDSCALLRYLLKMYGLVERPRVIKWGHLEPLLPRTETRSMQDGNMSKHNRVLTISVTSLFQFALKQLTFWRRTFFSKF